MSSSSLTDTLRTVTSGKLKKLEKLQKSFEQSKRELLSSVEAEATAYEKLAALYKGQTNPAIGFHLVNKSVDYIGRQLQLAYSDVSVPESLLLDSINDLEQSLKAATSKYEYANLFGKIVTEWIENPDQPFKDRLNDTEEGKIVPESGDQSNNWVVTPDNVNKSDLADQRRALDSLWFSPDETDAAKVRKYLDELFSKNSDVRPGKKSPLKALRTTAKEGSDEVLRGDVTVDELKNAIAYVLKLGLFVGDKREALLSLQSQDEVLSEMTDVINIDLESLDSFQYEQPLAMNFRRQVNLKSRVFTDEEVYVGILNQVVAARVSPFITNMFRGHFDSWTTYRDPRNPMTTADRLTRQYYLGKDRVDDEERKETVQNLRRSQYLDSYFLAQMPRNFQSAGGHYDEGVDWDNDDHKAPFKIRQRLLKTLTVEMKLHTEFYKEFTVFQTDIRLFHPSMSHKAISTILEYFGFDARLIAFLKTFLSPPVFWVGDSAETQTQTRHRGTSIAHCLSTVLGEVMMFCLDFAVNQRTQGGLLYRMHDDIWFCGREEVCVKAWKAVEEFMGVMGLQLNMTKTGTVKVYDQLADASDKKPLNDALPKGKVSWGMLVLDGKRGNWVVDQGLMDMHIAELRRQLDASKSIMSWVQRWNSYVAKYLSSNFGEPAYCLGATHVKHALESLTEIQRRVFEGTGHEKGGVSSYLCQRITSKFGVEDIPEGFIFWPNELGGLGLHNPFVDFLKVQMRVTSGEKYRHLLGGDAEDTNTDQGVKDDKRGPFKWGMQREEANWKQRRALWEEKKQRPDRQPNQLPAEVEARVKASPDSFMSLDEYLRFPEQTSIFIGQIYTKLQQPLEPADTDLPHELDEPMTAAVRGFDGRGNGVFGGGTDYYWHWIIGIYGASILQRFGGLAIAQRRLLPFGLLTSLRSERVRWQD